MRDEVLMQLVDKAMTDDAFRTSAVDDLEGTLAAHGFELDAEELTAVKEFHAQVITSGDVDGALTGLGSTQHAGG
jgi:hypothetical protein